MFSQSGVDETNLNEFLTGTVDGALYTLEGSGCIAFAEDDRGE